MQQSDQEIVDALVARNAAAKDMAPLMHRDVLQLTHDKNADAAYAYFSHNDVVRTDEVTDQLNVDYDAQGEPVGVEFLEVSDAIDLQTSVETFVLQQHSRQQRRIQSRGLANGLLKQAHGASLKRKTRRHIARASARRNRR